jgi:hypothetical protein
VVPTTGSVTLAFRIGDGPRGRRDVDLFRVSLATGQRLTIDVATRSLATPSMLASYLRLFDSKGRQLAANDDTPGTPDGSLSFTAPKAGVYYVGVSSSGNVAYKPTRAGSARTGSTGAYQIEFTFTP